MMKVFSHGSNVNFQTSTREMFFPDLERLLQDKIQSADLFVLGMIHPTNEQLEVYGRLTKVSFTDSVNFFVIEGEEEKPILLDADQLLISQEAIFTIEDEKKGQVDVEVFYLTYKQDDYTEVVYFAIDESSVTHPMACVVQLFEQVKDVGQDVDFSLTGCTANEWKPK
jgi:hypothetical protein